MTDIFAGCLTSQRSLKCIGDNLKNYRTSGVFFYYYFVEVCFLALSIWCSVCLLCLNKHLFSYIWEIFFYDFVETISCAFDLSLISLLYTIIHRFGLFIMSQISFMLTSWDFSGLTFSLTESSISSAVPLRPDFFFHPIQSVADTLSFLFDFLKFPF